MKEVITIGVDLAKNVFQVHGVDAAGALVVGRRLRRSQMLAFFQEAADTNWLHTLPIARPLSLRKLAIVL